MHDLVALQHGVIEPEAFQRYDSGRNGRWHASESREIPQRHAAPYFRSAPAFDARDRQAGSVLWHGFQRAAVQRQRRLAAGERESPTVPGGFGSDPCCECGAVDLEIVGPVTAITAPR